MEALTILNKNPILQPLEQSVIDKKVSLPANEIVTREYAPDIKPIMKLMQEQSQPSTKQEMQNGQKNVSYIPPKIKNQQFSKYGSQFHPSDYLGYHYAEQFQQMVYFRYNNQDFNELKQQDSQKGTKYFGGMFISLTVLQSKQFKAEQNIYSALSINAPEIKDSIVQSFAKNSKGCSFDPLFSSNFNSGNMMAAIRKNPYEYDIILQNDTNCKATQWFNFAVKFIEEGTYKFNIVNLSNQNPLYSKGMKVAYYSFFQQSMKTETLQGKKSGDGWSFGCDNIKFFKSDIRKETKSIHETYYCLSFEYKCKNRQDIVIFSSAIPYTTIDYERFLNRVIFSKIGQHMKMEKIQICQTLGGSMLSAYLFFHRKSKSNTVLLKSISQQNLLPNQRSNSKHKTVNLTQIQSSTSLLNTPTTQNNQTKTIVIMSRQHPGQTSSSYISEGIVQFLMDNTEFDVFKKNFQFFIVPFVNPDGVKYGNYRVNLAGADLKNSWRNSNQTFEPQVYNIKRVLKNINQVHPISLIINLSSSNQSLSSNFKSASSKKYCDEVPELFSYIMSKRMPQILFQKSQFSLVQKNQCSSILSDIFPRALVYDFTTSLYGWQSVIGGGKRKTSVMQESIEQVQINEFTPEIYRNIGRELIGTYLEYVRLCNKNIGIQDRWLKQIQNLPTKCQNKEENFDAQSYEKNWQRDLVKLDYSLFCSEKISPRNIQVRKHKTINPYRYSGGNLHELRSKNKKLTMPLLSNSVDIQNQQQNPSNDPNSMISSGGQIQNRRKSPNINLVQGQMKKPSISSLITPKRRSQILQLISETLKQPSKQKQTKNLVLQNNELSTKFLGIIEKKQKKLSGLLNRKSELSFNQIKIKDIQSIDDKRQPFSKLQNIKRSIPALGNKKKSYQQF